MDQDGAFDTVTTPNGPDLQTGSLAPRHVIRFVA